MHTCLEPRFSIEGLQGPTGSKDTGSGSNVMSGIHDGDIMASIKDPNMKEIVAKESLQYKPNSKNEGPEVSEENKKALANLLEVRFELDCKQCLLDFYKQLLYTNN